MSDAMISRACREFGGVFARDEASARLDNKKYYITRVLGSGATGVVLQARRTTDGFAVAVKIVDLEGMPEADKNRAIAEVNCLLHCRFFSIIRCYEDIIKYSPTSPTDPQIIALVLDYANAGDLRQEIKSRAKTNRPFKEHEAGLLFLQVLMAVHHVHANHMIHRDIKSANILLCSNGLVKLGDFGFSKLYQGSVSEDVGRTFCGTPYYVAPEIWRRSKYSKKADMFSLGVLLYELLALRRPFDGQNMTEVMERTLSGRYEPLPTTVSEEMRNVVSSLLSSDPAGRPTSAQLLRTPICKLFISGLTEIVLTQPSFDGELREMVISQIQQTKQSIVAQRPTRRLMTREEADAGTSSGYLSTTSEPLRGEGVNDSNIFCEGIVRKQSGDGAWKRRYLCIRITEDPSITPHGRRFDLLLALGKETLSQQCISTPFSDLEDVFPVPNKYTGSGLSNVFAIATRTGKRLSFQARSEEDRSTWLSHIQEALELE